MPHLFIILRRYGGAYDPTRPLEAQPEWEAHRVYMNRIEDAGISRLAGPLAGGGDVLLIFRAGNAEEVEGILAEDPWTQSGLLTTQRIARWDLRVGEVR
jgi:uncharacterized protein